MPEIAEGRFKTNNLVNTLSHRESTKLTGSSRAYRSLSQKEPGRQDSQCSQSTRRHQCVWKSGNDWSRSPESFAGEEGS